MLYDNFFTNKSVFWLYVNYNLRIRIASNLTYCIKLFIDDTNKYTFDMYTAATCFGITYDVIMELYTKIYSLLNTIYFKSNSYYITVLLHLM